MAQVEAQGTQSEADKVNPERHEVQTVAETQDEQPVGQTIETPEATVEAKLLAGAETQALLTSSE